MNKKYYKDLEESIKNDKNPGRKKYLDEEYKRSLTGEEKRGYINYINGSRKELIETIALKYKYTLALYNRLTEATEVSSHSIEHYLFTKSLCPYRKVDFVLSEEEQNIIDTIIDDAEELAISYLSKPISFRDISIDMDGPLDNLLGMINYEIEELPNNGLDILVDTYMKYFKSDAEHGYDNYTDADNAQNPLEYILYEKIYEERAIAKEKHEKEVAEEIAQQKKEAGKAFWKPKWWTMDRVAKTLVSGVWIVSAVGVILGNRK